MVVTAVADRFGESDDLDWKAELPAFAPKPGIWNEFAKDVAAMANTRGGLLVYGVSDQIEAVGVNLASADQKQMLAAVRNGIQPYISGIDFIFLPAPDGNGPDFLVVDIPPSEMAPHFQYGWEQKDKDRVTFNAPYRVTDDTAYMSEHHVARAYRERFARQDTAEARLQAVLAETSEMVLNESDEPRAWLVVAARLARPVPRMVPALTRGEAQEVLQQAVATASRLRGDFAGPAVLSQDLTNDMRVGLRRWVDSNFLVPDHLNSGRGVMVELHHDGSVTVSADLTHGLNNRQGIAVNTQVLCTVVLEAVALADAFRRHLAPDSAMDITASVVRPATEHRLLPFGRVLGGFDLQQNSRHPTRLLPASTELSPGSDDTTLREATDELSAGLLHQFGINLHQ